MDARCAQESSSLVGAGLPLLLTHVAHAAADFFISAINTKLWQLMAMIFLIYLVTFILFSGIWWGVQACASPSQLLLINAVLLTGVFQYTLDMNTIPLAVRLAFKQHAASMLQIKSRLCVWRAILRFFLHFLCRHSADNRCGAAAYSSSLTWRTSLVRHRCKFQNCNRHDAWRPILLLLSNLLLLYRLSIQTPACTSRLPLGSR